MEWFCIRINGDEAGACLGQVPGVEEYLYCGLTAGAVCMRTLQELDFMRLPCR
jgi:hypothetical protein